MFCQWQSWETVAHRSNETTKNLDKLKKNGEKCKKWKKMLKMKKIFMGPGSPYINMKNVKFQIKHNEIEKYKV
jgi:hypothetical protein